MLALYHYPLAVCAAKVRVVLAEKQLEWESRLINLSKGEQATPEYLALNPKGVVPTLIHGDLVVTESTVICEYLDDAFAPKKLIPDTACDRARMHCWTKGEDSVHDAINSVTTTLVFRPIELAKPEEQQAARIAAMPDPARRQKWIDQLRDGFDAPVFQLALVKLAKLFSEMELALKGSEWLVGNTFTLADSGLISFVHRLEMLDLRIFIDFFPNVQNWYARCQDRDGFQGIAQWLEDPLASMITRYGKDSRPAIEGRIASLLSETSKH